MRVLSGIQPTGSVHIGNYLGALKNWVQNQSTPQESFYCIVDLHAITNYQDPAVLHQKVRELAGILLALGIGKEQSSLVLQSRIRQHAELAWMLTCVTPLGWLERMTQFKAKADVQESIGDGILQYPVLMAADILLYQADLVPVGDDQKQHVELTRDIAQRFNSLYGETFKMPETRMPAVGARIMGLDDPTKKMSKSEPGSGHAIALLDPPDVIKKKIMRATTDSQPGVNFDDPGAGVQNLLSIYQAFTEVSNDELKSRFSGMRYGDFKKQVAEAVATALDQIQQEYRKISEDDINTAFRRGSEQAERVAYETVENVKRAMGLFTLG